MAVAVDWVEYTSHDFLYAKVLLVAVFYGDSFRLNRYHKVL